MKQLRWFTLVLKAMLHRFTILAILLILERIFQQNIANWQMEPKTTLLLIAKMNTLCFLSLLIQFHSRYLLLVDQNALNTAIHFHLTKHVSPLYQLNLQIKWSISISRMEMLQAILSNSVST